MLVHRFVVAVDNARFWKRLLISIVEHHIIITAVKGHLYGSAIVPLPSLVLVNTNFFRHLSKQIVHY